MTLYITNPSVELVTEDANFAHVQSRKREDQGATGIPGGHHHGLNASWLIWKF